MMPPAGLLHIGLGNRAPCRCWRFLYIRGAGSLALLRPTQPLECSAARLPRPLNACQAASAQQQRAARLTVTATSSRKPAGPNSNASISNSSSPDHLGPAMPKRYAVVGGGFAGVAVSWHLLSHASPSNPICLDLFDAYGLGVGGSGAAAGLLHPYTNRGKVLWRGLEAFQAALELVQAAEAAAAKGRQGGGLAADQVFAWRNGILRPARNQKQARDLAKFVPQDPDTAAAAAAELLDAQRLQELVPEMPVGSLVAEEPPLPADSLERQRRQEQGQQQRQQQRGKPQGPASSPPGASAAGLMTHKALVLHPLRYLHATWEACCQLAQRAGQGSQARLLQRVVGSLRELEEEEGPYDAVVVAAGAAVGAIAEMAGVLPIQLCQGYTLIMEPPSEGREQGSSSSGGGASGCDDNYEAAPSRTFPAGRRPKPSGVEPVAEAEGALGYPPGAPSLLGSPYIAAHGPASLVVGATKRSGLTPEEALGECSRKMVEGEEERGEAIAALMPPAAELWPPIAEWRVAQVKSGVRALPSRGAEGSIPFAGRVPTLNGSGANPKEQLQEEGRGQIGEQQQQLQAKDYLGKKELGQQQVEREQQQLSPRPRVGNWWFIGGLGARGLVYHAWLGRVVAEAVVTGDEDLLPAELLRWRGASAPSL